MTSCLPPFSPCLPISNVIYGKIMVKILCSLPAFCQGKWACFYYFKIVV
ncbi:hypothetical protein D3OALGA1CA_5742 [Olavius algarvensis associated proteobacterium Delta 3]|nr:hypothetical protein D3OALGB2SA_2432 [Olavius algarvensis associated proteobacterium Delta 3]CAB5171129.1 hypothetical protein D3OALGA1CA_5742 [Olavius algarvensis associated proteobacterium Delta 3]